MFRRRIKLPHAAYLICPRCGFLKPRIAMKGGGRCSTGMRSYPCCEAGVEAAGGVIKNAHSKNCIQNAVRLLRDGGKAAVGGLIAAQAG